MIRLNSQFFLPTQSSENQGKPKLRYLGNNGEFVNIALDQDVIGLAASSGSTIELSVDSATYVVTVNLKNAAGTVISTDTIDLPLESVVVNATYANGVLTLVLQNGNAVAIDITDIVSGLVNDVKVNGVSVVNANGEAIITVPTALADLADDSTHRLVTDTEKIAWNSKLSSTGDGSNVTVTFGTETKVDVNTDFASGSKISKLWGKAKAWFSSLKAVAFSGSYSDLTGTPTIPTSSDYVDLTSNQSISGTKTFENIIKAKNPTYDYTVSTPSNSWLNKFQFVDASDNDAGAVSFGTGTNFNAVEIGGRDKSGTFKNVRLVLNGNAADTKTYEFRAGSNNDISLGSSSYRWKNLFLGGEINNGSKSATVENVIDNANATISSPNLLMNSNFVINQRGAASYTGNDIITVDRWFVYGATISKTNAYTGGAHVVGGSQSRIYQRLDKILFEQLWGKTLTLTYNIGGTIMSYTATMPTTKPTAQTNVLNSDYINNYRLRITYYTNDKFVVILDCNTTRTYDVYWAKLEIGSTPTAYVPPLMAEELPKCQSYYQTLSVRDFSFQSVNASDWLLAHANFPVKMRTVPTTAQTHVVSLTERNPREVESTKAQSAVGQYFGYVDETGCSLALRNFSSLSNGSGYWTTGDYVTHTFDAEIY